MGEQFNLLRAVLNLENGQRQELEQKLDLLTQTKYSFLCTKKGEGKIQATYRFEPPLKIADKEIIEKYLKELNVTEYGFQG